MVVVALLLLVLGLCWRLIFFAAAAAGPLGNTTAPPDVSQSIDPLAAAAGLKATGQTETKGNINATSVTSKTYLAYGQQPCTALYAAAEKMGYTSTGSITAQSCTTAQYAVDTLNAPNGQAIEVTWDDNSVALSVEGPIAR